MLFSLFSYAQVYLNYQFTLLPETLGLHFSILKLLTIKNETIFDTVKWVKKTVNF